MLMLFVLPLFAQPSERLYHISVYPQSGSWTAKEGQNVKMNVLLTRCNMPVAGDVEVTYDVSEDMMKAHKTGKLKLKNGVGTIDAGTMKKPGFLRCNVYWKNGKQNYKGIATVGFSPEKLQPVTRQPADFHEFWEKTLANARKTELKPTMELMPDRCTPTVDVYHVSWGNNGSGSRMYGTLSMPKAPGKYPAIVRVPGAGVRGYYGEQAHAEKGFIVLEVGIHGIPVNLKADVYKNLYDGPLKGYPSFNMEDRERFYYKRVITGCVRAIDFIETLPQFNGNLVTFGSSQGGGLSIMVAALDPRVKGLVSYYPALSDMAGYTAGRAGGWPHTLRDKKFQTAEILETLSYYDTSSFARDLKVPGHYVFGFNDMVCPPTTTYSVFNVINAPKELDLAETIEHYTYPENNSACWQWAMDYLQSLPVETK